MKHILNHFAGTYGLRKVCRNRTWEMAISKKLVEEMGGTIRLKVKGVGTILQIRVPFKIDPDADKREEPKNVSEKSIKGLGRSSSGRGQMS